LCGKLHHCAIADLTGIAGLVKGLTPFPGLFISQAGIHRGFPAIDKGCPIGATTFECLVKCHSRNI